MKKSAITSGGASLLEILVCTATAGVALLTRQKCPKATWGKPQDPDAPERPPGRANDLPERRLNGAYKVQRAHLPPPPCGARKNLRAARLLDFFDRCGCSASLHPPLAALGFAPPFPSPAAGEGLSGQAAACSAHRLSSMTFCYRFAVAPNKMRLRHLISVVASDATFA